VVSAKDMMAFVDFTWFVLSEVDMTRTSSIELWFACLDIDGDGYLSPHDLYHIYEEQMHRMEYTVMEVISFDEAYMQIIDAIRPRHPARISLRELKDSGRAPELFHLLLNLPRLEEDEQRYPLDLGTRQRLTSLSEDAASSAPAQPATWQDSIWYKFAFELYQTALGDVVDAVGSNSAVDHQMSRTSDGDTEDEGEGEDVIHNATTEEAGDVVASGTPVITSEMPAESVTLPPTLTSSPPELAMAPAPTPAPAPAPAPAGPTTATTATMTKTATASRDGTRVANDYQTGYGQDDIHSRSDEDDDDEEEEEEQEQEEEDDDDDGDDSDDDVDGQDVSSDTSSSSVSSDVEDDDDDDDVEEGEEEDERFLSENEFSSLERDQYESDTSSRSGSNGSSSSDGEEASDAERDDVVDSLRERRSHDEVNNDGDGDGNADASQGQDVGGPITQSPR
jgi:hypothetical protein